MRIKPFRGIRPPRELAAQVSSRPYDVLSSEEARREAEGNPMSLYHIIKPEINFSPGTDEHDERVYPCAAEQFKLFREKGWLVQDKTEKYYVYAQSIPDGHPLAINGKGRTQYGLVVAAWVDDYMQGRIKKHELTRRDKEDDRMRHVRVNNANIEPVFFAYPHRSDLDAIIARVTSGEPEYDFVSELDGFRHTLWVIDDAATIATITRIVAAIPAMYIADGHHRSAAAARVCEELKQSAISSQQSAVSGQQPEYEYFLAVCFPDNQLYVMDYNRVVRDLNGMTPEEFLQKLSENFIVEDKGTSIYRPEALHTFALYLGKHWYKLTAKPGTYTDDPIGVLDVTVSSNLILDKLLGIKDLRSDKRIDFVGGIRGLQALQDRVDSGEMAMALALYPVTMQQIINIADSGQIMPPKTTWFEPKLRSGLVIHELV
jgi:uncharacterized protein (DUF1015 family)